MQIAIASHHRTKIYPYPYLYDRIAHARFIVYMSGGKDISYAITCEIQIP